MRMKLRGARGISTAHPFTVTDGFSSFCWNFFRRSLAWVMNILKSEPLTSRLPLRWTVCDNLRTSSGMVAPSSGVFRGCGDLFDVALPFRGREDQQGDQDVRFEI